MASLAFNPQLPLARPAPHPARSLAVRCWGHARLRRLIVRLAADQHRVEPGFVLAVEANALLDMPESVAALAASGCAELIVDLHTFGPVGDPRADQLAALVETIHAHGLRIHARFTLGFDHDDPRCFERLVDWVEAHEIASVELRLWTPDPGSSLTRGLARADRVRHSNFDHWDGAHVVVEPAQMSAQTLYRGWAWAQLRLASLRSVWRRRPAGKRAGFVHILRALEATFAPWRTLRRRRRLLLD